MTIANLPAAPMQSLPSPALQLHDIHLPEQISHYPIAPGWWLLLSIILISAVCFYRWSKKNKQLNSSKKKALAILKNNPALSATECINLLKWAAMQYGNRQQLAKLYGENFQDFLIKKLPTQHQNNFTRLISAAFTLQYQADHSVLTELVTSEAPANIAITTVNDDCYQATALWLKHALPFKKIPNSNNTVTVEKSQSIKKEKELSA